MLHTFLAFFFSLQKHCAATRYFSPPEGPSFRFLNTMRYGSKTCSSFQTFLMLLSIQGSDWCIFILGATPRIYETAKYEPENSEESVYSRTCNPATNRRQAGRKITGKFEIKGTIQSTIFCRFRRDVLQNSRQTSSQIGRDIYERPSENSWFNEDNGVFWDVRPLSTHHGSLAILLQPHCPRYYGEQIPLPT